MRILSREEAEEQGLLSEFFGPFKKKKTSGEKKKKDLIHEYLEDFDKSSMDYMNKNTEDSSIRATFTDIEENHEDYGGIESALDEAMHHYGILHFWELAHACVYLSRKYKGDRLPSETVNNAKKTISLMENKMRMVETFCRKHKIQNFVASQFSEAKKKVADRQSEIDEYLSVLSESSEIISREPSEDEGILSELFGMRRKKKGPEMAPKGADFFRKFNDDFSDESTRMILHDVQSVSHSLRENDDFVKHGHDPADLLHTTLSNTMTVSELFNAQLCLFMGSIYKGDKLNKEVIPNAKKVEAACKRSLALIIAWAKKHNVLQVAQKDHDAYEKEQEYDRREVSIFVRGLSESSDLLSEGKKRVERIQPSDKERQEFYDTFGGGKSPGCSLAKTKEGKFYVYTHRARSGSYKKISDIPKKDIEFIESTG